jgi:hypothetical protein
MTKSNGILTSTDKIAVAAANVDFTLKVFFEIDILAYRTESLGDISHDELPERTICFESGGLQVIASQV